MKKRIDYLDTAKGIAILLVVAGHTLSNFIPGTMIGRWIYSFHMPLFFILSGYFYRSSDLKSAIIKKARHLLLPYLIINFLKLVEALIEHGFSLSVVSEYALRTFYGSGSSARANICLLPAKITGMTWFLLALFFCQIIYLALDEFSRKYKISMWMLVIPAAYISIELSTKVWLPFSIQPALGALVFYHIGRCMARRSFLETSLRELPIGITIAGFCLWYLTVRYESIGMHANSYKGLGVFVTAAFATYVIVRLASGLLRVPIIGRFLTWCGKNSFVVFAFHAMDNPIATQLRKSVNLIFTLPGRKAVLLLFILRAGCLVLLTYLFLLAKRLFLAKRKVRG